MLCISNWIYRSPNDDLPCVPDKLKESAFPNTMFKSSESAWINSELFVDWFAFFLKSIPPTHSVLLVHSSHVLIELIEMAREN